MWTDVVNADVVILLETILMVVVLTLLAILAVIMDVGDVTGVSECMRDMVLVTMNELDIDVT